MARCLGDPGSGFKTHPHAQNRDNRMNTLYVFDYLSTSNLMNFHVSRARARARRRPWPAACGCARDSSTGTSTSSGPRVPFRDGRGPHDPVRFIRFIVRSDVRALRALIKAISGHCSKYAGSDDDDDDLVFASSRASAHDGTTQAPHHGPPSTACRNRSTTPPQARRHAPCRRRYASRAAVSPSRPQRRRWPTHRTRG